MTIRSFIVTILLSALVAFAGAALAGCKSAPVVIPDDLSAAATFQHAQDASDRGDYLLAIRYYTNFKDKHPESKDRAIWASYEIAFNYHKMGKNAQALGLLDDLLKEYDASSDPLPPAPRILAQRLRDRLAETLKPAS